MKSLFWLLCGLGIGQFALASEWKEVDPNHISGTYMKLTTSCKHDLGVVGNGSTVEVLDPNPTKFDKLDYLKIRVLFNTHAAHHAQNRGCEGYVFATAVHKAVVGGKEFNVIYQPELTDKAYISPERNCEPKHPSLTLGAKVEVLSAPRAMSNYPTLREVLVRVAETTPYGSANVGCEGYIGTHDLKDYKRSSKPAEAPVLNTIRPRENGPSNNSLPLPPPVAPPAPPRISAPAPAAAPVSSSSFSNPTSCIGTCVNESSNKFYDGTCRAAGEARGQSGCAKYATLGCVWHQKRLVKGPSRCVNESANRFYDNICSAAAVNGRSACDKYASLGCVWHEGQNRCE